MFFFRIKNFIVEHMYYAYICVCLLISNYFMLISKFYSFSDTNLVQIIHIIIVDVIEYCVNIHVVEMYRWGSLEMEWKQGSFDGKLLL